MQERFKQEIRLARKATHKNIMRTFDFGDAGGVQYLTMEYVKGYMLRDLVRKQKEIPLGHLRCASRGRSAPASTPRTTSASSTAT